MKLPRQTRFFAASLALVCVLFAQLAVASYACASMQIAHAMQSLASAAVGKDQHNNQQHSQPQHTQQTQHAMRDCAPSGGGQPLSCHDRGQTGKQSLDKPASPDVPSFMAATLVQTLSDSERIEQSNIALTGDPVLARAGVPPLAIWNCCFRI